MGEAAQLLELFNRLSADERQRVQTDVEKIVGNCRWLPQEGPQTDAYFSDADEVLFGGAAGGGKSDLLIGYGLNEARNAVIFRNGFGSLRDLEGRAVALRGTRDGFNAQTHFMNLGADRSLEFGSLEVPGAEMTWQGRRRDYMGFDEAAQMVKARVQFVLGWSTGKVIFATNPPLSDEGNWLVVWFAPWLDPMYPKPARPGELRWYINDDKGDPVWVDGPGSHERGDGVKSTAKSRTFIPSRLNDNRYLRDTDYRARVEALPEPMRSAMLNGNFMAARVDHAFQVLPSDWLRAAQARWQPEGRRQAMLSAGVDVAGGGADREVIACLHAGNWFAPLTVNQGVDTKDGAAVGGRIVACLRNGAPVGIDMTGGWGGAAREHLRQAEIDVHGAVFSEASGASTLDSRIPFANLRAEMYWRFREALDPKAGEDIALPPDPRIVAEGAAARWKLQGGRIQIESKEEIRARLGASTDHLDALVIAWHTRTKGVVKAFDKRSTRRPPEVAESNPFEIDGY